MGKGGGDETGTGSLSRALDDRSTGRPLPRQALHQMEGVLGADLSAVRLHLDESADGLAKDLGAAAFTRGNDVYFRRGVYAPETGEGRRLLAHELRHTVQQAASPSVGPVLDRDSDPWEHDAEAAARSLPAAGLRPPWLTGAPPALQRRRDRPPQLPEITVDPPARRLERGISQMREEAMPRFQQAIDQVSEEGIKSAGRFAMVVWTGVDAASEDLGSAQGDAAPTAAERARLDRLYQDARTEVLTRLTLQSYKGRATPSLGSVQRAGYEGDLRFFILQQTDLAAWVAKDTMALVDILGLPQIATGEQWRAIGLLRQHQNPWHFAYMMRVVEDHGLDARFAQFDEAPGEALNTIRLSQSVIRSTGEADPAQRLGFLQLLPREGKVRLLQPATPKEVAAHVYGSEDAWTTVLRPYNRSLVESGDRLLLAGTELLIDPAHTAPSQRALWILGQQRAEEARAAGSEPYIAAEPAQVAVPGNTIRYSIRWPNAAFEEVRVSWWAINDPAAVREGFPQRTEGPRGVWQWAGSQSGTVWEPRAGVPGNHQIRCRLTFADGRYEEAAYNQVVMTLEEKTAVEFSKDYRWPGSNEDLLTRLRQELERTPSGDREQRQAIQDQIRRIEESFRTAGTTLNPIRALYVSSEDRPASIPLSVFVAVDPQGRGGEYHERDVYVPPHRFQLKLWDFTLRQSTRTYTASGDDAAAALQQLLRTFADDAPYPEGSIRFAVPAGAVPGADAGLTADYPTDGGMVIDDVLRGLSVAALVIGVGAAALGQAEIAVPAFYVSAALGAAAATAELSDRLEHGDFEWDTASVMNVLEIAGAVATLGASSATSTAVRGARVALVQRVAAGVDVLQIAVAGGIHVAQISQAVESGDKGRIAEAVGRAIADGALFLIIHRATRGLRRPGDAAAEPPAPEGRRSTMSGTPRRGGGPPSGTGPDAPARTGAPETPPRAPVEAPDPSTPQGRRLMHEGWTREMLAGEMHTPDRPGRVQGPPPPRGTYQDGIQTPQQAYRAYDEALAAAPGQEVGIYLNTRTGEYVVRVGGTMSVSSPPGSHWQAVLHYHPNPENVLTYRMPAPADVQNAALAAFRRGAPVTEFVEYPMPGGGRSRVAYTVSVDPPSIRTEYVRPDGTRATRTFGSLEEYAGEWGSRTRYVDPDSPEYQWVVRDIEDYLRSSGGRTQTGGVRSTTAGTGGGPGQPAAAAPPTGPAAVDAAGSERLLGYSRDRGWNGLNDAERLFVDQQRAAANLSSPRAPGSREKTFGVLVLDTGEVIPLPSGRAGPAAQLDPAVRGRGSGFTGATLEHVEGHAAAVMHQRGARYGVLFIDNPPCAGCDRTNPSRAQAASGNLPAFGQTQGGDVNISSMLPPGARLDVIDPHSKTIYRSSRLAGGQP